MSPLVRSVCPIHYPPDAQRLRSAAALPERSGGDDVGCNSWLGVNALMVGLAPQSKYLSVPALCALEKRNMSEGDIDLSDPPQTL